MAQLWMRIGNTLEKQGVPFLVAVCCSIIAITMLQLKAVSDFWEQYFVRELPPWHVVGTIVFVFCLSFFLVVQARMRTSPKSLLRMARLLTRLRKQKVIDKAEERTAFNFFFVNFMMHRLGGDPRAIDNAGDLLQNKKFREMLARLGPIFEEINRDFEDNDSA